MSSADEGMSFKLEPHIPEGIYTMAFVRAKAINIYNGVPKYRITFSVNDLGSEHHGVELNWYLNLRGIDKRGRPMFKARGKVRDELIAFMITNNPEFNINSFSVKKELRGKLIRCRVVTVGKNAKQKKVINALQYSNVVEILVEAG